MGPTEAERLATLEAEIPHVRERLDSIDGKIDDFIKCADDRYATKITQTIVFGASGLVLSSVLVALIALVVVS